MVFSHIFFIVGIMVTGISALMVIPMIYEYLFGYIENAEKFLLSFFIVGFTGVLLMLVNYGSNSIRISNREVFILTFLSWFFCCLFACFPIFFMVPECSFINALFESVSALTTTGFSILKDFDSIPRGIFLWRSLLQLVGGIGIIVMAITVFPILRIGGMQLFHSEFSDRSEKILPKVSQIASAILLTYIGFMFAGFLSLIICGMDCFDAFCHSSSAISTGGFSSKQDGLLSFDNPAVEIVTMILMILGGATLLLFVKLWKGDFSILKDQQLKGYLKVIVFFGLSLTVLIMYNGDSFTNSLRIGFFSSVSVITSTGIALFNYMEYGSEVYFLIFLMSFIGGCSGSTTGGIKIFRFQIISSFIKSHINHLLKPHGVFVPLYKGKKISEVLFTSVFSFVGLYIFTVAIIAVLLTLSGIDFIGSLSGAASSLGNVGIGVGNIFGPSGAVDSIDFSAKIVLIISMILGRLELLTVLVLFLPSFWKK